MRQLLESSSPRYYSCLCQLQHLVNYIMWMTKSSQLRQFLLFALYILLEKELEKYSGLEKQLSPWQNWLLSPSYRMYLLKSDWLKNSSHTCLLGEQCREAGNIMKSANTVLLQRFMGLWEVLDGGFRKWQLLIQLVWLCGASGMAI